MRARGDPCEGGDLLGHGASPGRVQGVVLSLECCNSLVELLAVAGHNVAVLTLEGVGIGFWCGRDAADDGGGGQKEGGEVDHLA